MTAAKDKAVKDKPEKAATPKPVTAGPGRPANPTAPRNAHQVALAAALESAEQARDLAELAYGVSQTVATELALLSAEMRVASGWAAYCRSQGIHTTALKYAEDRTKVAGKIAALRELLAVDMLDSLKARQDAESDAGRMVGA